MLGIINQGEINWKNSTQVVLCNKGSCVQKFILPVPDFKGGGEDLIYPKECEKAGQPITDYGKNPIGSKGIIFLTLQTIAFKR